MVEPVLAKLRDLMTHTGMGSKLVVAAQVRAGEVLLNGNVAGPGSLVEAGDDVSIRAYPYKIVPVEGRSRLTIIAVDAVPERRIAGQTRIHAGYHKCLTIYFRRVMDGTVKSRLSGDFSFRHFFHRLDEFYRHSDRYTISSINGHAIDLDRFEDVRVTRFVRDPRDMVVSSYFNHARGAEPWCHYVDPAQEEWAIVDGELPRDLLPGYSLTEYLNKVSVEEGLNAEIDICRRHLESVLEWPDDDPRIKVFRYEDIVGKEVETFRRVFNFHQFPFMTRRVGMYHAGKARASKRGRRGAHIRNGGTGEWRKFFTPELTKRFNVEFGSMLEKLGYPEG